jgi:O-antigen/teichoic acid export membrane protein
MKSLLAKSLPDTLAETFAVWRRSPLAQRMARGLFWSVGGALLSRGCLLVAAILLGRQLGVARYGELGMIQSTVGMLGVFAGFGLGLTATKHVAEFRRHDPARAGRVLALAGLVAIGTGGALAIALLLAAPWLATSVLNAPHLANLLRAGAVILFFAAMNGAQQGALAGFEAFRTIARIEALVAVLSLPALVAGAQLWGLAGVVGALAIAGLVHWFANNSALRGLAMEHGIPVRLRSAGQELGILWRFSLPAALGGMVVGPVTWACSTMLVNRPSGYAEMGVYNAATQWSTAILFVPGLVGYVALPLLSALLHEADPGKYRRLLHTNLLLGGGAALAVAVPVALLAPRIMNLYGPHFAEGALVLRLAALTSVLMAANSVVGSAIASSGKMWLGFTFNLLWAAAATLAAHFLVSADLGAVGLAGAFLAAYCLHTVWQYAFVAWYALRGQGRTHR